MPTPPPPELARFEWTAASKLFPGPRCWATVPALWALPHLGFQGGLIDLDAYSLSAKFRLATFENRLHGGLAIRARSRELRAVAARSTQWQRLHVMAPWFASAFVLQLDSAIDHFEFAGFGAMRVQERILGHAGPPTPEELIVLRRRWQKTCRTLVQTSTQATLHIFMRRRLARYDMLLYGRVRAERAMLVLPALSSYLPARARAAVLRAWWNGWVTRRRFQQQGWCIFGCRCEDSIEHYARCPVVREFGARFLHLSAPAGPGFIEDFLVLAPRYSTGVRDVLVRKGIRLAAVYILHCRHRHHPEGFVPLAWQALAHTAKEIWHGAATASVARAWAPTQ